MGKRKDFIELYDLIENTGFLFNPVVTYSGSFLLRTGSISSGMTYDAGKDVFVLNSKVVNGKNLYQDFINRYFVSSFGNPPAKAITPAIIPVLMSEMNENGNGRTVKFSYTPTLLLLLEDFNLISEVPEDEAELALYVKGKVKEKRDKMFDVLRNWDKSPYYEEMKNRYEPYGYTMTYEFLEKQKDYFTKLIFILKDVSKDAAGNKFSKEKFEECFDKDKMILCLCKCIVDSCSETARTENVFHNCMVEVIQLIHNVKEIGLEKEFNPVIKYYNEKKGKVVNYSFDDLRKEVAQMLSEHPEFEIATVSMEDVIANDLMHNETATQEFSRTVLDSRKRQALQSSWEFIKPGSKEDKEDEIKNDFDAQMKKRAVTVSGEEKDFYLELMRKRLFFEKTGYMEYIVGINNFAGYVGYIYSNGLVIFEKMYEDETRMSPVREANATYVMNVDNFVLLSCMTKTEIINYIKSTANPDIKRVYHSKTWEQRLLRIIEGSSYDNVEEKIDTLIQTGKVRKQGNEMDSRKDKK